jgi:hypothetical protein
VCFEPAGQSLPGLKGDFSMTNRREFLQAATLSGLPTIAGAIGVVEVSRVQAPLIDLHAVVLDGRHEEALALGASLSRAALAVRTLPDGDITQLWLREVGPAWREQPLAIAGLTARPALFCLEQLAWSSGLRVVFHGEHVIHCDGQMEHSLLRGAQQAQLAVRDLERAGALWPARIARAFVSYQQPARRRRPGPSEAALEPPLRSGARLLTSWIIAVA